MDGGAKTKSYNRNRTPSEWQSRQTWTGRRQRNVAKAWKRGVFELHAGQCVCGLKMNKLIGRTSYRLCTFSTSIREIREVKYYLRDKKKKRKRGVKTRQFPPPWIRALYCSHAMLHHHSHTYTDMLILHMFFLLRSRTNRVARHQGNVAPNPELYRPKLYPCLDVYSSYYCHSKFFEKVTIKIVKRNV